MPTKNKFITLLVIGVLCVTFLASGCRSLLRELDPEETPPQEDVVPPEDGPNEDGEPLPEEPEAPEEPTPRPTEPDRDLEEIPQDGSEEDMRVIHGEDFVRLYPETVLRSGNPNEPYVALTFDDGPDGEYTPRILEVLKEYDVKATFFFVGVHIERHPDVARQVFEEGHLIASHGYDHANFATLTPEEIREDLARNEELIRRITGKSTDLFRPPYAALNSRAVETIAEEGYKIVLWNVDSLDWTGIPKQDVINNVLPTATSGSVILQHSSKGAAPDLSGTVEALPEIITWLRQNGYKMVTVDRLIELDGQRGLTNWYTVKPGDTLQTIAAAHNTTTRELMELNPGIDPNFLYVGQALVVRGTQHPVATEIPPTGLYTVVAGDTLWKIARKLGKTVSELERLNPHLQAGNLRIGEQLRVAQ